MKILRCLILSAVWFVAPATVKSQGTIKTLSKCPVAGTAKGEKDRLSNRLKRRIPPSGDTVTLSFADFRQLQSAVEQRFNIDAHTQKLSLTEAQRQGLHTILLAHGTVSEGDLVRITGYLVNPEPHPNTGETVNCGLKGEKNNDIHITMAEYPEDSGYVGIVVEMIPQKRPRTWSRTNLKAAQIHGLPVMVVGQLFYDEKHLVNDDWHHPLGGQPQRMSLFEVHPVTGFLICRALTTCQIDQPVDWLPLGP